MIWKIEFDSDVEKDLRKLGHTSQKRIIKFLKEKIATAQDPRAYGKALSGNLMELWRYRVGDYRVISKIEDDVFTVLVIKVGHRKEIYD
ncbi:MAG: type II toxin-antitoxin system RelE/ParE family toxin [Legionellales bacterium]|nr:type II toxin-antitoxin system RelE/ParE family toxin [Legionellales bacterium]